MSLVDTSGASWTYGAEHELADWDTTLGLPTTGPADYARADDWTLVNSNGIAVQPNPRVYRYGGEINTPPTADPEGQVGCLVDILDLHPNATVNHRSNLHVHIRVPGLKDSLPYLKKVQRYVHYELPGVLAMLEPIPAGLTRAEKKRERRRHVSHQTFLTPRRVNHQLCASTVQEFFEREVPQTKIGNKPLWHAQPRVCVNLRQLLQTDTVEFRHFPGTLDTGELLTCVEWCRDFLLAALRGESLRLLWSYYSAACRRFPRFPKFDYRREVGYQATASHNGLKQAQILLAISLIEGGRFVGTPEEYRAAQRACGLSR